MVLSKHPSPDTLIWLGVGHNADLSQISSVTQVVFVDANPSSLKTLEKQHCTQDATPDNFIFAPVCLAPQKGEAEFYHYSLSEYSALSEVTGLRELFPGIKLKNTQTLTTTAVADFIRTLSINTQNNTLRIDIIDQCLPLLRALAQEGLLDSFNHLELQTSAMSLYRGAATTSDIVQFLGLQGYELQTQGNSDPDIPTLGFVLNPLWKTLQNVQQQLEEEKKKAEQAQVKQVKALADKDAKLTEAKKVASEALKQLEIIKVEKIEQAKALVDIKTKLEEHAKAKAEKEAKLVEVTKQRDEQKAGKEEQTVALAEVQTQNKKLKAQNLQLQTEIESNGLQLEQLKAELLKAEAQIALIHDLLLKDKLFQGHKGQ